MSCLFLASSSRFGAFLGFVALFFGGTFFWHVVPIFLVFARSAYLVSLKLSSVYRFHFSGFPQVWLRIFARIVPVIFHFLSLVGFMGDNCFFWVLLHLRWTFFCSVFTASRTTHLFLSLHTIFQQGSYVFLARCEIAWACSSKDPPTRGGFFQGEQVMPVKRICFLGPRAGAPRPAHYLTTSLFYILRYAPPS